VRRRIHDPAFVAAPGRADTSGMLTIAPGHRRSQRHPIGIRALSALVGGAIVAAAVVAVASAHAVPVRLSPADGAVLGEPPAEVWMDSAERMSSVAGQNDLIVDDASGAKVTRVRAQVAAGGQHMSVPLPSPLPLGTYRARWFTVAADDSHPSQGAWGFTYDPAAKPQPGHQPAQAARFPWARVLSGTGAALLLIVAMAVYLSRGRSA